MAKRWKISLTMMCDVIETDETKPDLNELSRPMRSERNCQCLYAMPFAITLNEPEAGIDIRGALIG